MLLALVAGCGFSAHGEGPGDPTIDAAMPDAPITNDDVDGDGVANAADNCPMKANPLQYDEDADSKGDECDACPQLAGADVDTDSDGVGDPCDPHPTTPGDKLAYWNGFNTPGTGLPSGLVAIHGGTTRWSVASGDLVFTRNGDDWAVVATDVMQRAHTSDSTFDIVTSYQSLNASAAGVDVDVASNDDDVFNCQARIDNDQHEMWHWDGRAFGGWTELATVSSNTTTATYRITLMRTMTDLQCKTIRGGSTLTLTDGTDSAQHTRAGVFARNVDVRYHYLAVYTSP